MPEPNTNNDLVQLKAKLQDQLNKKVLNSIDSDDEVNNFDDLELEEFLSYAIQSPQIDLFQETKLNNKEAISLIKEVCEKLHETIYDEEFLYYDSQFNTNPSLFTNSPVSIPGPSNRSIHVFTAPPSDYKFRNLLFKDIFMNPDSPAETETFVLLHYEDEQTTRQTIRFIIMKLYNVFNNSMQVDLIVLYLLMKVCASINEANKSSFSFVVRTKYENMARVFMKRHGNSASELKTFLEEQRASVLKLRDHFEELKDYENDEDLFELFEEFVALDFKVKTPLKVA
jgi:hypothetical protein